MAGNVFGTPVTDATLKGMTEYHDKAIQADDRACVALEMKNAEGKDADARNFVDKIQAEIEKKGVRCLIYNATGGPLKLAMAYDYAGCVSEAPYATLLQNGQWTSFVHEKAENRSSAAIVYESTQDKPGVQWLFGWNQTDGVPSMCYAEIRQERYYCLTTPFSAFLDTQIRSSGLINAAEGNEELIFTTIGNTAFPIFEVIMTKRPIGHSTLPIIIATYSSYLSLCFFLC